MIKKSKAQNQIILWILRLIASVILFQEAYLKLIGDKTIHEMLGHIGIGQGGYVFIGILEVLTVMLILIPHSSVYGAFLGLGIVTGAIIGHLTGIGLEGIHMAIIVFICCLFLIYYQREDCSLFKNMMD